MTFISQFQKFLLVEKNKRSWVNMHFSSIDENIIKLFPIFNDVFMAGRTNNVFKTLCVKTLTSEKQ